MKSKTTRLPKQAQVVFFMVELILDKKIQLIIILVGYYSKPI